MELAYDGLCFLNNCAYPIANIYDNVRLVPITIILAYSFKKKPQLEIQEYVQDTTRMKMY